MKIKRSNILNTLCLLACSVLVFFACTDDEQVFEKTRLFRPVLNDPLETEGNTIIVDMGKLKEAQSYTIEVSRDTFQTVDYTFEIDTNYVEINENVVGEELLWFTLYQVRATAHAADPQYDSRPSDLGTVRTQKYPSSQGVPDLQFDVTDTQARVFWSPSGAPITTIKVYAITDLRLENPLFEYELSPEEMGAHEAFIGGLSADTEYQIALFSQDELRGWEVYSTKIPLDFGNSPVYDLSGIDNEDILVDTLADVDPGSVIILEPGRVYAAGGYSFSKSVMVVSGYGFTPSFPIIDCGSNYNLEAGASVDSIVFRNIRFQGDFGGNYAFNIDQSGSIGEIKFDGCQLHSLRGVTRIKGGTGMIDNYTIVNSVADSINGYGVFYVDTDGWTAGNVNLVNSTFSKCQYFLASRTNTGSITIESCTIDKAPESGRQMFRWRGGDGNNNVTDGIKIYNTIWGPGWDYGSGSEETPVKGVEGLASTNFDIVNTWATSDFSFSGDEIAGFPAFTYSGTAEELWEDRDNVDYDIKDSGFTAKNSAGDPRWRPGL